MGKHFLWDPVEDNIIEEFDDAGTAGTTTADYTTEPYLYGDLISQRRDGESRFYHFDGQGSTISLTDSAANVTDNYAYTAFGEVTEHIGTTVNAFQYVGRNGYCRVCTQQYYVRRRLLSSFLGRWLSLDPQSLINNDYTYSKINPLSFIDPKGEDFIALAHYRLRDVPIEGVYYHYSLERWECPEFCELVDLCRQYEMGRDYPYIANCVLRAWTELGGFDMQAHVLGIRLFPPPNIGARERVWAPIAVITYNRPDHGPVEAIKPIFINTRLNVIKKWDEILANAWHYEWAEQEWFQEAVFVHWPKSLYYHDGTNSRTYIREMVRQAALPWCEMTGGEHPGRDTPQQNTAIATYKPHVLYRFINPQPEPSEIRPHPTRTF